MKDFEYNEFKSYKGYDIQKVYELTFDGKRKGKPFYIVADDEDYLGEEYQTLKEAKAFIDSIA